MPSILFINILLFANVIHTYNIHTFCQVTLEFNLRVPYVCLYWLVRLSIHIWNIHKSYLNSWNLSQTKRHELVLYARWYNILSVCEIRTKRHIWCCVCDGRTYDTFLYSSRSVFAVCSKIFYLFCILNTIFFSYLTFFLLLNHCYTQEGDFMTDLLCLFGRMVKVQLSVLSYTFLGPL